MTTPSAPPSTSTPSASTTATKPATRQGPTVTVTGPLRDRFDEILTPKALAFLTELHHASPAVATTAWPTACAAGSRSATGTTPLPR